MIAVCELATYGSVLREPRLQLKHTYACMYVHTHNFMWAYIHRYAHILYMLLSELLFALNVSSIGIVVQCMSVICSRRYFSKIRFAAS